MMRETRVTPVVAARPGATMSLRLCSYFYDTNRGWIDGTTEFHQLLAATIEPGSRILEVGPGPSNATSSFLSTLGHVTGVDLDEESKNNDALEAFEHFTGATFPFKNASFDAIVSNYVLEHVEHVDVHLSEIDRVLRPGGIYAFRTPNAGHYTSVVARFTPHWFHVSVANRLRGLESGSHEPYPTFHRMNSRRAVQRMAGKVGLGIRQIRLVEKEPSYGLISPLLFLPMVAFERIVNRFEMLADLRSNIFAVLEKPMNS